MTFACDTYSNKAIPINPRVFRVRTDISWKEVVRKFAEEGNGILLFFALCFILTIDAVVADTHEKFTSKPIGYWTMEQNKNMRKFFEDYARHKNRSPLDPETWYRVSRISIMKKKVISSLFY